MKISSHHQINYSQFKNNPALLNLNIKKPGYADTVSFGANPRKEIRELKTKNENGQFNIKTDTAALILNYFGYNFGNASNHQYIVDDYGNKINSS